MIRSTLGLPLIALALAGCSPSDPHQAISSKLTDGVIVPIYSAWSEADRQLAVSAKAFCADQITLAEARQAFSSAQSTWAAVQPVALGPLAEGNRAWQIQFWPDKKNLVARQVEALVKAKPELTPADLDKSSVVVQGLTAYEYLLFDPALDLNDSAQKARYCPLLTAIGDHQQTLAADILGQWQSKDGIAAQLKNFPNARHWAGRARACHSRTKRKPGAAKPAWPTWPQAWPALSASGLALKMTAYKRCSVTASTT
jgi:predicted lipoprotein